MNLCIIIIGFLIIASGPGQDFDERLNGTRKSNREETVAEAFRRHPDALRDRPELRERFETIFGHMELTYDGNEIRGRYKDDTYTMRYKVLEKGDDFVVIRSCGECDSLSCESCQESRIRFESNLRSYWVDFGLSYEEKFDRIK